MAPSGCILSCFGRRKKQQEEPQTSNGLKKLFRCLKHFCCIGKSPTQSFETIQDSANNEASASADDPALSIHPIIPTQSSEASTSANNEASTSTSADNPAHLIHPLGPEIVGNTNTADSPILLPNQRGFPRFTDPEIESLLASQMWRLPGENVPNELGFIRSTVFNFRSAFVRRFYMGGLVPPETEGGLRAGLLDANRRNWVVRLRNLRPRGIGLDYEEFAIQYGLSAHDYVYLLQTSSPHRMLLVFVRKDSLTDSLAALLVPYSQLTFPAFSPLYG